MVFRVFRGVLVFWCLRLMTFQKVKRVTREGAQKKAKISGGVKHGHLLNYQMWWAVGGSVYTPHRLPRDWISGNRNDISEQLNQNWLFSPGWRLRRLLPVAALLPMWWRRWMRRPGGSVESPSCTRFKSEIVFFEVFKLLIKPFRDLLCKRKWFVSFSSDFCSSCRFLHFCFASVKSLRWFLGPCTPSLFEEIVQDFPFRLLSCHVAT